MSNGRGSAADQETVQRWRTLAEHYLASGLSRSAAYRIISSDYGVNPMTLWRHLHPGYRSKCRADSLRRSRTDPNLIARRREYMKAYNKERNRRPEVKAYQRWYHRLIRNPEKYGLPRIFEDGQDHDSEEVAEALRDHTGVDFGVQPVRTFLGRYVAKARGPPFLEDAQPGTYRMKRDAAPR